VITTVLIAPILTVLAPPPRPTALVETAPEEDPAVRAAWEVRSDLGVALLAAALGLLIGFGIERRVERHAIVRAQGHGIR
jgi:hypothetical protein